MIYSNILIPVDGSEDSEFACDMAVGLMKALPGKETIHLLHCVDIVPALIGGKHREELLKEYEEKAELLFKPCRTAFEKVGNTCLTHVLYGEPGQLIAQAASDYGCDLIIMGSRGMNDLKGLVLGSVSHHVLQYAEVPVLLARKPRHPR